MLFRSSVGAINKGEASNFSDWRYAIHFFVRMRDVSGDGPEVESPITRTLHKRLLCAIVTTTDAIEGDANDDTVEMEGR